MRTKEKLAQVLEAAGLRGMAVAASKGYYDDFESPIETPIVQLVIDLQAAGRDDLANRAMCGEWDSTKEEADDWFQREGKRLIS
jgi:hypothetical protein